MRKNLLNSLLLSLLFCLPLLAQDVSVSGRVTSSDDGTGLPGVSVQIKGTTRGTTSDANGTYRISAPANARLVFSYIGFNAQEVAIGNRGTVNMALQSNAQDLGEVVVTGYGGTVNRREFTGASSKVSGKTIENLPFQSFDKALQGRAAGVQVTSANGVPGGAVQIRVRGVGSISAGSDPLYVVDGVQLNSTSNSSYTSNNPLAFLNPNDIESIEILKDAAAASIYGSQAANGVVLVTTKRGKAGKTQVSLNYYKGFVDPLKKLNVLNTQEWIQARTEALVNSGVTAPNALTNVLSTIRQPVDLSPTAITALPTYDWQEAAYQRGSIDNYELSLNGGNDKTKFFISGSYNAQDANIINVNFKRGTINSTLTHTINNRLTIEERFKFSTVTQRGQFGGPQGGSFFGSAAFSSPLILPSNPIYNPDGSFYGTPNQAVNVANNIYGSVAGSLNQNIIQVSNLNDIRSTINTFNGGVSLTYKIMEGLTLTPSASLDYRVIKGRQFQDPRTGDGFNVRGRIQDQYNENVNFLTNATLNYSKSFGNSNVSVLLGTEYRSDVNQQTNSTAENVPTPDFKYANSAANPITVAGFWTGYHRASLFGNLKYSYNKKYDVSLIARYDGSSRFGVNNRYGFFPSASAAWLISEEDFLKSSRVVSEVKLRASYGITGNDLIGSAFAQTNFPSLGLVTAGNNYNSQSGTSPTQLGNNDLKWETTSTINLGLDYGLFNNRITGSVDAFERVSKDLLLAVNLPYVSGYSTLTRNSGQVTNRGLEVEVSTVNVDRAFKWKTSFNITFIKNNVDKLYDGITPLANPDSVRLVSYTDYYNVTRNAIIGKPLNPQYTFEYAGVNPATGRPMWYDSRGNITYTPSNPRDLRYLGTELPKFYGGFTNTFTYGGLSLDVFMQYDYGRRSINNETAFLSENGGRTFNALRSNYYARWQKAGDITDVPRPIDGNAERSGSATGTGSRYLEDASYLRLKQVTLSYQVSGNLLSRLKVSKVRVYGQATNLLTLTNWSGYDPEWLNFGGNGNSGTVPSSKAYTFGVNITL